MSVLNDMVGLCRSVLFVLMGFISYLFFFFFPSAELATDHVARSSTYSGDRSQHPLSPKSSAYKWETVYFFN